MPKKRGSGQSKSLTLDELSANFHLPINDVAQKLGLCVTVLKQRCREHGITRWPYRKVKKLDNIINALETPVETTARTDGNDAGKRLESVKKTRNILITDPNSKAHLRIGKLKAVRKRAGLLSSGTSSGSGSGGSHSDGSMSQGGGGYKHLGEGGIHGGLLEAAACASSLSDDSPGTPSREHSQPPGQMQISGRSPRTSWQSDAAPNGGYAPGLSAVAAAALGGVSAFEQSAFRRVPGAATGPSVPQPRRPVPRSLSPTQMSIRVEDTLSPSQHAAAAAAPATSPTAADFAGMHHAHAAAAAAAAAQHAAAMPSFPDPATAATMDMQRLAASALGGGMNPHVLMAWMAAMGAGGGRPMMGLPPAPKPAASAAPSAGVDPAALQQMMQSMMGNPAAAAAAAFGAGFMNPVPGATTMQHGTQ